MEKLSGTDLLSYLKDKILKYVDFSENSYMVKDPFGVSIGGSGLMATPMDIMKVLYIIKNKGTVTCCDGIVRELISADLLELATSNLSDTLMTGPLPSESQGYGMQIWQNEKGGFVLYGMGGQLAIYIPDKDLYVVTTADTQGMQGGNQVIYDAIYELLLPQISDIPVTDGRHKELEEYCKDLHIEAPRLPAYYAPVTPEVTPGCYKYQLSGENSLFSELTLNLNESGKSSIIFTEKDSDTKREIHFGIGSMQGGEFADYNTPYTAGAVFTRSNVLYIRVHLIGESVGSLRFQLYFEEKELTVFMRKIEETYFGEFDGHLYGKLICQEPLQPLS